MDKILVAIASYKRPEGLSELLESLKTASISRSFDVIVVDNDAAGTARNVAEASPLNVTYVVEPKPGIAAARNRAVDEIPAYDAVIFVDDDEYVTAGWLDALAEQAESSSAGVIIGPVTSVFPPNSPKWIIDGGFIQRPVWPDRTKLTAGATNNTLLKVKAWKAAGAPRFDDSFSATGGSDAKLFSLLLAAGVAIEFCADAIVYEPVLPERMRLKWLARRAYRNGIVSARIWLTKHGALKTIARGALMSCAGLLRGILHFCTGKGVTAEAFNSFLTGLGVISAVTGIRVHEYKR